MNAMKRVSPEVVIVDCELDLEKMFNLTGPVEFDRQFTLSETTNVPSPR